MSISERWLVTFSAKQDAPKPSSRASDAYGTSSDTAASLCPPCESPPFVSHSPMSSYPPLPVSQQAAGSPDAR
jgi:hypothetical protein